MFNEQQKNLIFKSANAVSVIKNGGVIAFPTDTVYCLAASIICVEAVEKIFEIKGRETTKALPVLISDIGQMRQVAEVSELAEKLTERFMPGGLTLVLKKKRLVSDIVSGGKESVAVRIPGNILARNIIDSVGTPLTGTRVDAILDQGVQSTSGKESTIIDLSTNYIRIIREGSIPVSEIEPYIRGEK